jgi:hypothetical protein
MKKRWLIPAVVVLFCLSCSCAGGPFFDSLQGKQWKLVEVKGIPAESSEFLRDPVRFDRAKLKTEGMDDIFVLAFDASAQATGTAAPETYTASYEQGAGQALSFRQIESSHSQRDWVPERLRDVDSFARLEKVTRWDYRGGKLELYSADPHGREVVLLFVSG